MALFNNLKIIHVLCAAILFGTGISSGAYVLFAHRQNKANYQSIWLAYKQLFWINMMLGVVALLQLITGFGMVYLLHYNLSSGWIIATLVGFALAGFFCLPMIYFQIKCRELVAKAADNHQLLSKKYYQYLASWCLLGVLVVISLTVVFYYMANF